MLYCTHHDLDYTADAVAAKIAKDAKAAAEREAIRRAERDPRGIH